MKIFDSEGEVAVAYVRGGKRGRECGCGEREATTIGKGTEKGRSRRLSCRGRG